MVFALQDRHEDISSKLRKVLVPQTMNAWQRIRYVRCWESLLDSAF